MLGKEYAGQDCAIARALEVVGERWTLLIVRDAFYGVRRFNDFAAHLDVPKAVLSDRLRRLVETGVLSREPDPEHAGRAVYALTSSGEQLWPVLHSLLAWGEQQGHRGGRVFAHADCGTRLDALGRCSRCGVTPTAADIISSPRRGRPRRRTDPVSVALRHPRRLLEPLTV